MAVVDIPLATIDQLANELLSQIELKESGYLNWGFIETRVRKDDLGSYSDLLPNHLVPVWNEASAAGLTIDELISNLIDRKLLFQSEDYYRTRFSEAVRLLALLRQRFTEDDWNTAPRLVSDLKTHLTQRRYPRRDISVGELTEELSKQRIDRFRLSVIERLLQDANGQEFQIAAFQRDAIEQILRNLRQHRDRGLAIGAGTGAGKTMAFFVPALAEIAASISDSRWTQAIAIYPRIELLKDQFLEAFAECRKLDSLLRSGKRRPISIGAYYGETPYQAMSLKADRNRFWEFNASQGGWECPFLRCPNPSCETTPNLIWRENLVEREAKANERGDYGKYAVLECPDCRYETPSGALALTRDHLSAEPPDILFATTEMLNRRLSRTAEHSLFGIGRTKAPRLMLLDEIHTYDGIRGAQVAYVLRRWQYARALRAGESLTIVGLSATLTNAEEFLSQLTGLPPGYVTYIQPREDELLHEGIEYNLVLKGDPVSGTSLLSTTVQTAMLLGRILDPLRSSSAGAQLDHPSRGAYGRKMFAFTDKLDVINRWYHIELDAERKQRLSRLRLPDNRLPPAQRLLRRAAGQEWVFSQVIGHDLAAPLRVDLVSSQYRGVRSDAELIIATSTLEVGFNDLEVGAVLQHKAPRSMASFLQRKGRAGRTRQMRPWTIVVTSAYGRDRWAFQHAEQFYDPTLPPIHLPIDNFYVQKIQASFALMDWLARRLAEAGFEYVDSWELLAGSKRDTSSDLSRQRRYAAGILLEVLTGDREADLVEFIRDALGLQEDSIALQTVLWDPPRSLMLDVIPTVVRQLETNWSRVDGARVYAWGDVSSTGPLPEFVTTNLFSDLNTPELLISVPRLSRQGIDTTDSEELALALGMVEFAPGHVNKRFARPLDQKEAHWLALPEEAELSRGKLSLDQLDIVTDKIAITCDFQGTRVRVFRPRHYRLARVPDKVRATSSARLRWQSRVDIPASCAEPTTLSLTRTSLWRGYISGITSHTHRNQSWVTVTRAATGVDVDLRYTNGRGYRANLEFEADHEPAALGFAANVDAICLEVKPLDGEQLLSSPRWTDLYRHLGPLYFRYRLEHDKRLTAVGLSTFEFGWLWQLELSMLVATAVSRNCSLPDAAQEVQRSRELLASRTLDVIFQATQPSEEIEGEERGRLYERLLERLREPSVVAALEDNVRVLWEPERNALLAWLRESYLSSIGHVFFTALSQLVPEVEPDDLHLDIDGSRIWITEQTAGGVGQISRISDLVANQPRLLDAQLRSVLFNCERATLAEKMSAVATEIGGSTSVLRPIFAEARTAKSLGEHDAVRRKLITSLDQIGITGTRELIVSINSKFLRAGSGSDTDELLAQFIRFWESEETRLGCDIDLRVLAVASSRRSEIDQLVRAVLLRIDPARQPNENQVFNLLQSLLWLDCSNACPDCIEKWFPYADHVAPSRALLAYLYRANEHAIQYGSENWWVDARHQLERESVATIVCPKDMLPLCKRDLVSLVLEPVDMGLQFLYASVQGVRRGREEWFVDLVLADVANHQNGVLS